jgi:pimeloyl-ACP methyl ester carboxylesterase
MPGGNLKFVSTSVLEVAFEDDGPRDASPVMLLHGWPDAPRGWNGVAQAIRAAGWRTIVPYLRGLPPTRFLSGDTPRFGAAVALAQDAIDLADALGIDRLDWVAITLNAYRARWVRGEEVDSRYDSLQRRLSEVERLSTPTLMIQGGSDYCDDPKESEGLERFFAGRYDRLLLEDVGHFPHRESPIQVAESVIRLIQDAG